jgi:hypothetical protein
MRAANQKPTNPKIERKMNPFLIGLLAVLSCIGLLVLLLNRPRNRHRPGSVRLANIAEGTHGSGRITKLTDAAISGRYRVVKFGSDSAHVAVAIATDTFPIGIVTDEASAAELPVNVALFGQTEGTIKILLAGTVAAGDEIEATTGGAGLKLPITTGTYYPFGRALAAGVSGDTVEIMTYVPIARAVA